MIEEVRISNVGVIESAQIRFGSGMSALTGETGAGKTMTVTALQLLMGAKADSQRVRQGADAAEVEGVFVVPADSPAVAIVREAGGSVDALDDGLASIIVARHVPRAGRSRAYAGGRSVPAAVLEELAQHLVVLHGQADQRRLSSASTQREAVDAYGGAAVAEARKAYDKAWHALREAERELLEFEARATSQGTQRMAMQMLVNRVDAVQPRIGEDEDLKAAARRLDNVESLRSAMMAAAQALSAESAPGAGELIDQARTELQRTGDPQLAALAQSLEQAAAITSDTYNELGMHLESLNADPEALEAIHARRAEIRALERQLGMSVEQMLAEADRARLALAELEDPAARREELAHVLAQAQHEAHSAAAALTKVRTKAGSELASAVTTELASLYMKDATFTVAVTPRSELAAWGGCDVEFLLAPHAGSAQLPLGRTASGGEMSRIMLAVEVSLAARVAQPHQSFIFDEIDAGIGGKSALAVGKRLVRLARNSQVLCVTHLAQVAAYAHEQIVVAKDPSSSGSHTSVQAVTGKEREVELARMLSGHEESESARAHAAELLASAVTFLSSPECESSE